MWLRSERYQKYYTQSVRRVHLASHASGEVACHPELLLNTLLFSLLFLCLRLWDYLAGQCELSGDREQSVGLREELLGLSQLQP